MPATLFEYRYRDAGNYKARGSVVFDGALSEVQLDVVRAALADDGFFIAEQLNVPPLYKQLYQWSGGPTDDDHCWHEFVAIGIIGDADVPANAPRWGPAQKFLLELTSVERWREDLSPHFRQDPRLARAR